jgi:hypothetical protein
MLYSILGLFVLFSVVNLRSVDFTQVGIFVFFFLLSLRHNRAVTDAALATYVILAAAPALLEERYRETSAVPTSSDAEERLASHLFLETSRQVRPLRPDRSSPAEVVLGSILLLSISAHASVFTYYYDFNGAGRQTGFGITANMPTCAVDFIARHQLAGHAFVSYPFASLLIYRMHPSLKVNMDSRNDVYGEELFHEYLEALRSPDAMRTYLQRHWIDFFFLSHGDRVPAVFDYLQSTGEWAPVYYDDRAFILVKHRPETEDLIRREGFRFIRPAVEAPMAMEVSNIGQVLQEAERAIRN